MKSSDKKHRLAYQDVFLYTSVTSQITDTNFEATVSSPFTYKDGDRLDISAGDGVVTGIGQRNFQRNRLFNGRGKIFLFGGNNEHHPMKIVGKWNRVKNVVTLYPTERLLPEEIKVLNLVHKHLTENNITTILDIDEKHRYRNETRQRRGDRVQQHAMPSHYHGNISEDDDYDEYES